MEENNQPLIDPQKYPNFWEQMEEFRNFLKDVGQDAVAGNGFLVSEEKAQERMNVCMECPQFDPNHKRCYLCGCFMEAKIKFKSSECPAAKW